MKLSLALGLGALSLAAACAPAVKSGPEHVTPDARSFHVGALEVVALRDARFITPNDAKTFGVDVGRVVVASALKAAKAADDRITLSVDALLVKDGTRLVLIDTGVGPGAHGALVDSLTKVAVDPAEITDVLLTHTHGDHAGGLVDAAGALTFPNAAIRLSAREWAWMQDQDSALAGKIAAKVRTFNPGDELAPGITAVDLEGHTPGHVGYEIVSGADRLLDIGDVAHSSILSLGHPDWVMGFDNDPVAGKATRLATLARLAASGERVFAPHFPFPGVGHIRADGGGFAWAPDLK